MAAVVAAVAPTAVAAEAAAAPTAVAAEAAAAARAAAAQAQSGKNHWLIFALRPVTGSSAWALLLTAVAAVASCPAPEVQNHSAKLAESK